MLIRTHIEDPVKILAVIRLIHAGHYLGYMYLPQNREIPKFVEEGYKRLVEIKLLTPQEAVDLLAMRAGQPSTEVIIWALRVLRIEMDANIVKPPIFRAFEGKLHSMRDLFDELLAFTYQPIPFAYYHLMNILCELYLIALSYVAIGIKTHPYYSIFGYFVSLLALLGLREAAGCLADPLGLDECDIPVFDMVRDCHYEQVYSITRTPKDMPKLTPILGFGTLENLNQIKVGLNPADYWEGVTDASEETYRKGQITRYPGHYEFWQKIWTQETVEEVEMGHIDESLIKAPPGKRKPAAMEESAAQKVGPAAVEESAAQKEHDAGKPSSAEEQRVQKEDKKEKEEEEEEEDEDDDDDG